MAKKRQVDTIFWRDGYTANLDPSEKLVFLYLLTNPDTNISGIYQIPLKTIAADTGFDKEIISLIMNRFEKDKKIKYENGWVAFKNFIKHQNEKSPKIVEGIKSEMLKAPESLRRWVQDNENLEGIDTLSHLNSNINSNLNINSKSKELSGVQIIEFESFWKMYDKKVNRIKCEKLWQKINPDSYNIIITHVADYVKSTPDKKFRKDPGTYLYNQCWNDEIISGSNKPEKPEYSDNLKRLEEKYGSH